MTCEGSLAPAPAPAPTPRPELARRLDDALSYASSIELLHFNDVYNIEGFKKEPVGGAARFKTALAKHRRDEATIVVFSGDAFAPSVMSTMLEGAQMPPVLERIGIDVAMLGNHDFDFGLERCVELKKQTSFPWLLSNAKIGDKHMGDALETVVLERGGKRIGFVGLIEFEWLSTLNCVSPEDVTYEDFVVCAKRLSHQLRHQEACDAVVALTHMRAPNDRRLASECPREVDLILGGHDHHYEVFRENNVLVCKSGTDFKDATLVDLTFPPDEARARATASRRVVVDSSYAPDGEIQALVDTFSAQVEESLDEVVGAELGDAMDARFVAVRTSETNCGNLVADVIRQCSGADAVILNAGTLRSDTIHDAGPFTKRDLVQLLPMADEMCVLGLTGDVLRAGLENAVSQWPRLEGRFAQVSGLAFAFDASKPPDQRVQDVLVGGEPLDDAKTYSVAMKQYMRTGKDGFSMFSDCPVHTDALPALQNMLAQFFASRTEPVLPPTDGRIRLLGAAPVVEPLSSSTPHLPPTSASQEGSTS